MRLYSYLKCIFHFWYRAKVYVLICVINCRQSEKIIKSAPANGKSPWIKRFYRWKENFSNNQRAVSVRTSANGRHAYENVSFSLITALHLYYRNIVYFKCFTALVIPVTANRQIRSIVLPTRGTPARGGLGGGRSFSNKFRHAISSLPEPWERSLNEWPRVASTFHLRADKSPRVSSSASSSLSIEVEGLYRTLHSRIRFSLASQCPGSLSCKKIIGPLH